MEASSTAWGVLSGLVALVLGKAVEWYYARRKSDREDKRQRAEQSIPLNEQAVKILQGVVATMREDVTRLTDGSRKLEEQLLQCREDKLDLKAERDGFRRECEDLRGRLTGLEGECKALRERVTQLEGKK